MLFSLFAKEESNRGLQMIAGLMAITLWIFVGLLPRMESDKRKMMIGVKVKNAPRSLRTDPGVAEVLIVGPKAVISKLSDQDLEVFVDLKQRWEGHAVRLPLNISGPPGIRWDLSPPEVQVIQP